MKTLILILDADKSTARLLKADLILQDVLIQECEALEEMVEQLNQQKFDLVIMSESLITFEYYEQIFPFLKENESKCLLISEQKNSEFYQSLQAAQILPDVQLIKPFSAADLLKKTKELVPTVLKKSTDALLETMGLESPSIDEKNTSVPAKKSSFSENSGNENTSATVVNNTTKMTRPASTVSMIVNSQGAGETTNFGKPKNEIELQTMPFVPTVSMQLPTELGANKAADFKILNEYIKLKEDENNNLRFVLENMEKKIQGMQDQLKIESIEKRKILVSEEDARANVRRLEQEKEQIKKIFETEVDNLRDEFKDKIEKLRQLEKESSQHELRHNELKDKVTQEIRKHKLMQRELENKLELQKRDSMVLIRSKDDKLLELQRQLESVQFDYDALKEKLVEINAFQQESEERISRVVQSLKMSMALLDKSVSESPSILTSGSKKLKDDKSMNSKAS